MDYSEQLQCQYVLDVLNDSKPTDLISFLTFKYYYMCNCKQKLDKMLNFGFWNHENMQIK